MVETSLVRFLVAALLIGCSKAEPMPPDAAPVPTAAASEHPNPFASILARIPPRCVRWGRYHIVGTIEKVEMEFITYPHKVRMSYSDCEEFEEADAGKDGGTDG